MQRNPSPCSASLRQLAQRVAQRVFLTHGAHNVPFLFRRRWAQTRAPPAGVGKFARRARKREIFVTGEIFDLFFGLAPKRRALADVRLDGVPFGQTVIRDVNAGDGSTRNFLRGDDVAALLGGFGGCQIIQNFTCCLLSCCSKDEQLN